jgi:hypothetical protein
VFAHAAGAVDPIEASLVKVTESVLLAATVNGVVRVCEVPLVAVAKFQLTVLVLDVQLPFAVVRALSEKPVAPLVLAGS